MSDSRPTLALAHSPDPDDVFMWWPITGKVDVRNPGAPLQAPVLDTGRFRFKAIPADIDVLNRRAVEHGDLDITAVSMSTYPYIRGRYALTACGSSMGYGYGPKLVARAGSGLTASNVADRLRAPGRSARLAIPGAKTTAYLVFSLMVGGQVESVEMPFDRIMDAVSSGSGPRGEAIDAGLLIHQAQLTFATLGLEQIADVGAWWRDHTGLPLPLGGNAVRRDLDDRFGPGTCDDVAGILLDSIRHALANRDESIRYAMSFAPEIDYDQANRYIDMYVNDLTVDAGIVGRNAVRTLLSAGFAAGLCPDPGDISLIGPSADA
ncbi:MAG: ABC transporter substrate-binding protein [Phycisphaeraceae bacterium]|nr:ABC transporter substrate-binding protein [Phycisphaeraceae bacterium]